MTVEFKNVKVVFSNMMNRLTKDLMQGGRTFSILINSNSPEFKQLQDDFKALNEYAKEKYGEEHGKKVKDASREEGLGAMLFGDLEADGKFILKFPTITFVDEKEVTQEDGSVKKQLVERLNNRAYKTLQFTYELNNNGEKVYETLTKDGTLKTLVPSSNSTVNVVCGLYATYNKTANRVTIRAKAIEVHLVERSEYSKSKSQDSSGVLELPDNRKIAKKVEYAQPSKEEVEFTTDELVALDVTNDMAELDV